MRNSIFKYFWWDIEKRQFWFDFLQKILFIPGTGGDLTRGSFWSLFIKSTGDNFQVRPGVKLSHPEKFSVGSNVRINVNCYIDAGGGVNIGNNVLFGPSVKIWSVSHIYFDKTIPIYLQGYSYGAVNIRNDVWIGSNAIILPNVTIGEGVIIGASSLITGNQNLQPYAIYAGIPAKIIKKRA